MKVFADTSYFLASLNGRDQWHHVAVELAGRLAKATTFVTTEWVLMELANGLAASPYRSRLPSFVATLRSSSIAQIVMADSDTFERGLALYEARPDKEWSLTDCISFLVMREMKIDSALTADRHFEQAGFRVLMR